MASLENKIVLIIGGTSGVGYGVAEAALKSLAESVIVASSNRDRVENAIKRLSSANFGPGKISGHVVDAGEEDDIKALFEKVGAVDHIVFTSGRLSKGSSVNFPNVDIKATKGLLDVRFWGAVAVAKHAKFRPGGGSFTITSGLLALKPVATFSVVAGTNSSLHGLTKGLAIDLAPVRVNAICLGVVKTEIWEDIPEAHREHFLEKMGPSLLVKHIGMPDEIAEAYLFCMKCNYVTGQCIAVDGGQVLCT